MEHIVCTVFDQAADAYLPPFFVPSVAIAERSFLQAVGDSGHQFFKFPKDYTLMSLGVFDDSDGSFNLLSKPSVIITGLSAHAKVANSMAYSAGLFQDESGKEVSQ